MKNYEYTFKQIIENFNLFKLGTIIESEYGDKYKLTKTENDTRKFSRINKGLRFMTYDNIDRNFRIVKEEQQDIDYWEVISNAFREYSDKLIERCDEISKFLKNKEK